MCLHFVFSSAKDDEHTLSDEFAKHSSSDDMSDDERRESMGFIIDKMDVNKDDKISREELKHWVEKMHHRELKKDIERVWNEHHLPNHEYLSWETYKDTLVGEDGEYEGDDLDQQKILLARDKRRWDAADLDNDGKLSQQEASSYLHPEYDPNMRSILIQETLEEMDKNNDGFIDVHEFVQDLWTPSEAEPTEPEWVVSSRTEFLERHDKNKDGKLDKSEIEAWLFPPEFDHIVGEVENLFKECDTDQDEMLSREEILHRYDLFLGSQATNFGEALSAHDEL